MKKIRIIFLIILALVIIVSVSIIIRKEALNSDNNETSFEETFYSYEETELGNETEISSEDYMPTEEK